MEPAASIWRRRRRWAMSGSATSSTARSCARIAPNATRWVDLGSGGGFPGLVTGLPACRARRRPASIWSKATARRRRSCRPSLGNSACRRASLRDGSKIAMLLFPTPQIVTARALAPLPALLDLSAPWLTSGARGPVPQRPGLPRRGGRKRSPLGLRSGRTSKHDRPARRHPRSQQPATSAGRDPNEHVA